MSTLVNKGLVEKQKRGRLPDLHYATGAGFTMGQAFALKLGLDVWVDGVFSDDGGFSDDGREDCSLRDPVNRPLSVSLTNAIPQPRPANITKTALSSTNTVPQPRPASITTTALSSMNTVPQTRPVEITTTAKATDIGRRAALGQLAKEHRPVAKPPDPPAADRRPFGFWYLDESKSAFLIMGSSSAN
jgi:hypothetical protein